MTKIEAIEKLKTAFEKVCAAAYEGWAEAQSGSNLDMREFTDQRIIPAQNRFSEALDVLMQDA